MMNGYECCGWLWSATDRQTPPTPPPTTDHSDDDGRAYIYIFLMQCDVNFMHNSSRHQQWKLPSPAGAEQALGGASDD
jgi:hypothetical protein